MRSPRLVTLLVIVTLGPLLLSVAGWTVGAVRSLRRLADEQALNRVTVGGNIALHTVERSSQDLARWAETLAEQPILHELLADSLATASGEVTASQSMTAATATHDLTAFLERFRQSSDLSGCAVLSGDRVLAASRLPFPASSLPAHIASGNGPSLAAEGPLVLVASAPLKHGAGLRAVTLLSLDEPYAAGLHRQLDLDVALLTRDRARQSTDDSRGPLRVRALVSGEAVAARQDDGRLYTHVQPLRNRAGEVLGTIEVALPTGSIDSSLSSLRKALLFWTTALVAAAALLSLAVARKLGRPLEEMTRSAARIGSGDLSIPVPRVEGGEIGTLSTTMEEMRTRLVRLTAELRRQRAEADAVLTGIVEGVYSVDRERRIQYMNPQAAALLGIEASDAIGRFCGDVLNPKLSDGSRPCDDDCPIVHARFRGSARAAERLVLAGGARRSVVVTSSPPAGGDLTEESAHQFQLLRDETEVEATRRMRDAVLANISHEFRTPLSAQLASIEMLRDRLPELEPAEAQRLLLSIERGSLRLTQLIDNLLESVRIESGQTSIREKPVAMDQVVEQAAQMMMPLIAQKSQQLEIDLPYPLASIRGDAPRLSQVFINLLANASKFAPSGTTIRIGGGMEGESLIIWVEDEGPGMPEGAASSLFGVFVRSEGEEPEQSGMGIGLWIVRSIVERHGGRVEIRRGQIGSKVCVILPRMDESSMDLSLDGPKEESA